MALDPGTRYIGIAVSDPDERIALPLKVLDRTPTKKLLENLASVVKEKKVTAIIVGRPISFLQRPLSMTKNAEEFAELIKRSLRLPITLVDERLSTKSALIFRSDKNGRRARAQRAGTDRKARRVDQSAAAVFLQTYLDNRHGGV